MTNEDDTTRAPAEEAARVIDLSGRTAEITLTWADGSHRFKLDLPRLQELQEKCNAGPNVIFNRLADGSYRVEDIRETLRLGLIGAGMDPAKALSLVVRYVDAHPLAVNVKAATLVAMAAIVGVPGEPVGEPQGAKAKSAPMEKSASPQSTE